MERLLKPSEETVQPPGTELLLEKAEALKEWDVSSKQGLREAAKSLLEILQQSPQKIDLPDDQKTAFQKVGQAIMANKDKTAAEILDSLVKDLGFVQVKEEKAAQKKAAQQMSVEVEANAALVGAFAELSALYFKEGNRNAGATYSKVAKALSTVSFEIDAKNAPGLSKGKTKIPGIGKSSGDKIVEFITTGKMDKLEEKRAAAA